MKLESDFVVRLEQRLTSYFQTKLDEATAIDTEFGDFVAALADFVLCGGKRIRPTFAWWSWRACGGSPETPQTETVLTAISALELLQASALIHDDLIDSSVLRRGRPTVHIAFAKAHRESGWFGPAPRFGQSMATLLGDLALAWADDLIRDSGLALDQLARISEPWRLMRTEMLAGQYLDVLSQAKSDESVDTALGINRLKTASYTVACPLHLGAALADANPAVIAGLREFGTDIGIAFQLRDDLLGVFGDSSLTGKPAGDDLREGKRTVLMALALQHAELAGRHADAVMLRSALGNQDLTETQVDQMRALFVELGAVQAVENRIAKLTERALTTLTSIDLTDPGAAMLVELAGTVTARNW